MQENIENLMLEEHKRIINIIREFESIADNDLVLAKEKFSRFKWNLEKHFFVEEKAIFSILDKIKDKEVSDIFDLMYEHGSIIELINNIEVGLNRGMMPNLSGLRIILVRHVDFENEVFYPQLNQLLSPEKKQEIIERIKEVIRG